MVEHLVGLGNRVKVDTLGLGALVLETIQL